MVTLTACALLAWLGAEAGFFLASPVFCALYWGFFVALLGVTFLIVWLDIRYIRLQYTLERRSVFKDTLGDEKFREELLGQKDPPENDQV